MCLAPDKQEPPSPLAAPTATPRPAFAVSKERLYEKKRTDGELEHVTSPSII